MKQEKIWDYFQNEEVESFSASIPRLKFLLSEAEKNSKNQSCTILNIGIGNGWLEKQCLEKGWNTFSLDPSEKAVNNLIKAGVDAKVGYIESIPYPDNTFDFVFCSEVIEHLSDEQIALGLEEIKRITKNQGYLIGTVPYQENLSQSQVICPDCGKIFHRWGHLQSFDKIKLTQILRDHQFTIVNVDSYAFPDFSRNGIFNKLKSIVRYLLGRYGLPIAIPNLYFIAQK